MAISQIVTHLVRVCVTVETAWIRRGEAGGCRRDGGGNPEKERKSFIRAFSGEELGRPVDNMVLLGFSSPKDGSAFGASKTNHPLLPPTNFILEPKYPRFDENCICRMQLSHLLAASTPLPLYLTRDHRGFPWMPRRDGSASPDPLDVCPDSRPRRSLCSAFPA